MSPKITFYGGSLVVAAMLATMSGCYAEATTGADVEYESTAPAVDVEVYPHEYYQGHVVYLVGDRWYYHDGPRWVYYRHEPTVLYQRRAVIRRAPAVRQRAEVRRAPPAYRREAPPRRVEERRE
ncbi:MAG TPA: hypothetical protein VMI54_10525 [Polyangiaceae bacterium]|nr:hypothetical protein [Polyangiaceae bacterium]